MASGYRRSAVVAMGDMGLSAPTGPIRIRPSDFVRLRAERSPGHTAGWYLDRLRDWQYISEQGEACKVVANNGYCTEICLWTSEGLDVIGYRLSGSILNS